MEYNYGLRSIAYIRNAVIVNKKRKCVHPSLNKRVLYHKKYTFIKAKIFTHELYV